MFGLMIDVADGGGGIDDRKGGVETGSIGEGEWWEEKDVKVARHDIEWNFHFHLHWKRE